MIRTAFALLILFSSGNILNASPQERPSMPVEAERFHQNNKAFFKQALPSWEKFGQQADQKGFMITYSPNGSRNSDEKVEIRKLLASQEFLKNVSPLQDVLKFKESVLEANKAIIFNVISDENSSVVCEIYIPKEPETGYATSILLRVLHHGNSVYFLEYWKKGFQSFTESDKEHIISLLNGVKV